MTSLPEMLPVSSAASLIFFFFFSFGIRFVSGGDGSVKRGEEEGGNTMEGFGDKSTSALHALQRAFVEEYAGSPQLHVSNYSPPYLFFILGNSKRETYHSPTKNIFLFFSPTASTSTSTRQTQPTTLPLISFPPRPLAAAAASSNCSSVYKIFLLPAPPPAPHTARHCAGVHGNFLACGCAMRMYLASASSPPAAGIGVSEEAEESDTHKRSAYVVTFGFVINNCVSSGFQRAAAQVAATPQRVSVALPVSSRIGRVSFCGFVRFGDDDDGGGGGRGGGGGGAEMYTRMEGADEGRVGLSRRAFSGVVGGVGVGRGAKMAETAGGGEGGKKMRAFAA